MVRGYEIYTEEEGLRKELAGNEPTEFDVCKPIPERLYDQVRR